MMGNRHHDAGLTAADEPTELDKYLKAPLIVKSSSTSTTDLKTFMDVDPLVVESKRT